MAFFTVLPRGKRSTSGRRRAFLITDNWDDWAQYSTLYHLIVIDETGEEHSVGGVKIGEFQMDEGQRRPNIPTTFDRLDIKRFFSLGQDDSYYEALKGLSSELRTVVLAGLGDVAIDENLFTKALSENVMQISLLRSVSPVTVRGQFRRMAKGDARLTPYDFTYTQGATGNVAGPPILLEFTVIPESQPPTNIHVLIGRNGVGKTRLLRHMSRSLVARKRPSRAMGMFGSEISTDEELFANVVSVTFSAFDPFTPLRERKEASPGIRYSYIGLQRPKTLEGKARAPKSPTVLRGEFVKSVSACRGGAKGVRWREALETLQADPLFRDAELTSLADDLDNSVWQTRAATVFEKLSSGHKVVLLTITRLVETVEERTLVLMDEPEAHLHPPLLSAFIRALSDLLVARNGVAIIATHSPVILQEVPRTCVWKLRRTGGQTRTERPDVETFGENVGVLTRETFGLEVTESGFHTMLQSVIDTELTYDAVLARFDDHLGAEAKAIVRGLVATRDSHGEDDSL